MIGEDDLRKYLDKFDKKYWATYKVLDILQKVFYRCVSPTNAGRHKCTAMPVHAGIHT